MPYPLILLCTMPTSTPFILSTHGRAEIPHPAERAVIHVSVSSQGTNKAFVSDEVITTAQHIERLLRDLSPPDSNPTPEAKAAAPLAHWSKTGLSATSYVPHNYGVYTPQPRQYTARITFDIRFQKFRELGAFGTKLSALPHAEVSHIDWILTASTRKAYQSQLRKAATRHALEKARDYCDVLSCGNLRPVELSEGTMATAGGGGGGLFGSSAFGRTAQQAQVSYQQQQSAPGAMGRPQTDGANGTRDESPLEFTPKEVRMNMDVTVKFHAE